MLTLLTEPVGGNGWWAPAKKIGLELAPDYWSTDGSRDPAKLIKDTRSDEAVKAVGAASNYKEFMEKGGFWIDQSKPYENYHNISKLSYCSPHGRVRIYVDEFVKAGYDPTPHWTGRWHRSEGEYKYSMIATRAPWLIHADPNFVNNPALKILTERNFMDCVWIHPDGAKEAGVAEGDKVLLENNPKFMTHYPNVS